MTDHKLAELLYIFDEIETLMVQNGADQEYEDGRKNCFQDKVNSFDTFEAEPEYPGNISHKFELAEHEYKIKNEYIYDRGIQNELARYVEYIDYQKRYLKYKNGLIGGNYYVLKKIAYERNKLLHIYNYEIPEHKLFVKDCRALIRYLENPDKKPFLTAMTFLENDKINFLAKAVPTGAISKIDTTLQAKKRDTIGILQKVFQWKYMLTTLVLLLLSSTTIYYLSKKYLSLPEWNMGQYLLAGGALLFLLYHAKRLFGLFTRAVKSVLLPIWVFLIDFFSNVFLWMFQKNHLSKGTWYIFLYAVLAMGVYYVWHTSKDKQTKHSNHLHQKRLKSNALCKYYKVIPNILHIRKRADIQSPILDKVHTDDTVCITAKQSLWMYVNKRGWVNSTYLKPY